MLLYGSEHRVLYFTYGDNHRTTRGLRLNTTGDHIIANTITIIIIIVRIWVGVLGRGRRGRGARGGRRAQPRPRVAAHLRTTTGAPALVGPTPNVTSAGVATVTTINCNNVATLHHRNTAI